MYGLIKKMRVVPDRCDELIDILVNGQCEMRDCLSDIVAKDPAEADSIWVTEAWASKASHEASLSMQSVQGGNFAWPTNGH